jgi:hypothetical protein
MGLNLITFYHIAEIFEALQEVNMPVLNMLTEKEVENLLHI